TTNQPVTPAITATIVPASSAWTMNGKRKSSRTSWTRFQESPWKTAASGMGVRVPVAVHERRLRLADDDEAAGGRVQHLDRRAVQAAERLARDHVRGPSLDRAAAGEVDDAVEVADQRVDVVGDEHHRDPLLVGDPPHERGDRDLVRQVEAVERL